MCRLQNGGHFVSASMCYRWWPMQKKRNSSVLAMELCLFCIHPSTILCLDNCATQFWPISISYIFTVQTNGLHLDLNPEPVNLMLQNPFDVMANLPCKQLSLRSINCIFLPPSEVSLSWQIIFWDLECCHFTSTPKYFVLLWITYKIWNVFYSNKVFAFWLKFH